MSKLSVTEVRSTVISQHARAPGLAGLGNPAKLKDPELLPVVLVQGARGVSKA